MISHGAAESGAAHGAAPGWRRKGDHPAGMIKAGKSWREVLAHVLHMFEYSNGTVLHGQNLMRHVISKKGARPKQKSAIIFFTRRAPRSS